jgi:toxin FitB
LRVLLDTCVLSELRRPNAHSAVRRAIESFDGNDVFVSVLTIGEISNRIALLAEGRNKRALQTWLQTLETNYSEPSSFG